jgi:hypothetical protein
MRGLSGMTSWGGSTFVLFVFFVVERGPYPAFSRSRSRPTSSRASLM